MLPKSATPKATVAEDRGSDVLSLADDDEQAGSKMNRLAILSLGAPMAANDWRGKDELML